MKEKEIKILSKGLKFCPNESANKFELFIDARKFLRKLTLKRFFKKKEMEVNDKEDQIKMGINIRFKPKSNFFPHHEKGPFLETFYRAICDDFEKMNTKNKKHNLSKEEYDIVQTFRKIL